MSAGGSRTERAPGADPIVTVRMAASEDAEPLARLRLEFRASIGTPEEEHDRFLARCTDWMSERLRPDSRWRAWIATRDERIVGTVWIGLLEKMPNPIAEPEENGYLTNFYVVPDAQGMGVGTALLEASLAWCRERQIHALVLWPTVRSRPLYERHGFGAPAALMEKVVTGDGAPWPSASTVASTAAAGSTAVEHERA